MTNDVIGKAFRTSRTSKGVKMMACFEIQTEEADIDEDVTKTITKMF